jgi:predicted permease
LSVLFQLFANNLLPILLIASGGFFLGKIFHLDPETLSKISFYLLGPCLLFSAIAGSEIQTSDAAQILALVLLLMASLAVISLVASRLLRLERNLQHAFLLGVIFMNSGNFGLSLNLFAFGEPALAFASIFFVFQSILVNSLGVLIASSGTKTLRKAAIGLLKVPGLYAVVLAVAVRATHTTLPPAIERSVDLLGQAAIPMMLLLLGVQLQRIKWAGVSLPLVVASTFRLALSPLVALLLVSVLGLEGPARQGVVLEAATPTAVVTILLSTEFDLEPQFISSVVLATTLLCPLTLTPILAYLGS